MRDALDLELTGVTPAALGHYERALRELQCFVGDPVGSVEKAIDAAAREAGRDILADDLSECCRLNDGEQLPLLGPERDAALLRGGMVDRQLDLDLLAVAADLQLDAARAGDAAAGGDGAGDAAAAAVEQVDIVRPEIEQRLAVAARRRADSRSARSAIQTWPSSTLTGSELESPMKP